ncbi:hypothetical protein DSO57_1033368 [Entomophthora muscae]|uniref:Uncharacterized protein n=1 Tax=Entomophthora muscae TaxID=34485 RepID=A0ACC2SPE5_9FUNG|nr:hypothetical protein DSO57_1033368 [Entomophthora muscae]
MPYLGFSYSYQYLQRVIKQKLYYPQGCIKASPLNGLRITSTPQDCHLDASENSNDSRNIPESPNAPIAGSLNKVKHSDSLACEVNQVSEAQYLEEEDQVKFSTKSSIIPEEYSEKKQDLVHEVLISKDKGTSLAAPIALLYPDLLEPSPVDHNIRGEDSAKDDDFVLHEVEIVGLVTFQKLPLSLPEPLPAEDPGTAKPFPIGAGDCFKDEKLSEDDKASQEEKVVELLISQVEYISLAENVTVSLLSLPKSLPPKEPSFILQPHNKSCSRKGIEYHLESFGSLDLTEVNPGQFSFPGITDRYIQPGHFPCEDHQSCAKVDLTRAKVCYNDVGDFKDDEVPSLTEPEEIRCSQDKDQSLIPLSSECCSKDEDTEKDIQEAESVAFPISQVEKESLVEKIVVPPFSPPELLPPEDSDTNPHESSFIPLLALPHCKKDFKTELLHSDEMQEPQDLPLPNVALLSSIADELYDKLLVDQSLWEEEPTEIQSVLKKLSVDTKLKDGQLFKLYKDKGLPYVCLSLRTDSVVASHKATGHGVIQKTLAQLQKHCY